MRWLFFVLIICSVCISCVNTDNKETVRRRARQNECYSFLNQIVRRYVHANYKMPDNLEDLLTFVSEWEKTDVDFWIYEADAGIKYRDALKHKSLEFAFYQDSVFFYMEAPAGKIGCCEIGTPHFWLEHPDIYQRNHRGSLMDGLLPSAFYDNGKYLFETDFDYNYLIHCIDSIEQKYSAAIFYPSYYFDVLTETSEPRLMPFLSIISFDVKRNALALSSRIPERDSLYVTMNQKDFAPIDTSLTALCADYLQDLSAAIKTGLRGNPQVGYLVMGIRWYCNRD